MSMDSIQKALDSINRIIFKLCVTFILIVFLLCAVIIYKDYKAYDYDEYPSATIENTNVSGDNNEIGDDE